MKLGDLLGKKKKDEAAAAAPAKSFDVQQLLDDFRNLDPRDPSLWPTAPRVLTLTALLAALIGAGWWFGWTPQLEELAGKQQEEESLRTTWLDKKKQAVNLDAYRAQLAEIDASFGVLLEQLPNASEIGALLVDINKTAQGNGLNIELFRPGGEARKDFYAEIPITVEFTGSYHDIGAFASDLSQLPRIVTLNGVDLQVKGGKSSDLLTMKATAKTFRYLDEGELAAQKRAEKKGAKRGAK